ncbi:MAG: hypothetical protein IJK99_09145 [Bacteroidales bacterium]|nr:hypothetical protein [Bacteroidales bacterium]
MVIDNFALIAGALRFDSDDDFYFLQVLQRKKDNPAFPQNNKLVKYYVVRSLEYFHHIEPEVKAVCEATTARAYIGLNRRSFKKCTIAALTELATIIRSDQYVHLPALFTSVAGSTNADTEKKWIIDIDTQDDALAAEVADFINGLEPTTIERKLKLVVSTLHGVHLITTPFNLQRFKERFPDIDVHKDNPTLLYFKTPNEE